MLKKTSAPVKIYTDFFIWKIDGKSCKKRENRVCAQKSKKKNTFGTTLFSNNSIFNGFLGIPWVARGSLGHPGNVPKSSIFPIYGQFRVKTGPDGPPEGSRQSPGVPRAPKGYHCKSIV